MENKYLVGSKYFFQKYNDYILKDIDYLILVDEPKDFNYVKMIRLKNIDYFYWRKMSADEFVKFTLEKYKNNKNLLEVGKFLIPEFVNDIGFTIEHLKKMKELFYKLDAKHEYEKIIYEAYIENNDFCLTEIQRQTAYNKYKNIRQ